MDGLCEHHKPQNQICGKLYLKIDYKFLVIFRFSKCYQRKFRLISGFFGTKKNSKVQV